TAPARQAPAVVESKGSVTIRGIPGSSGVSPAHSPAAVRSKEAVTAASASTLTVQGPVPEQAPLHPWKRQSVNEVAESVTAFPVAKVPLQMAGHAMPKGSDWTE